MKKASKRLINAIIALVASVILCIGVCLAWFAMNNDVSGNGMQTQVGSGDIVSFNVTAYYLDYSTENKNYSVVVGNNDAIKNASGEVITIDHNNDKKINSSGSGKDVMRPYSVSGGYTTAVLYEVKYEIADGSDKKFRIFAECEESSRLKVTKVSTDNFTSYLSNTVTFVNANQSGTANGSSTYAEGSGATEDYAYTAATTGTFAFVNEQYEKSFHVGLKENIEDSNKTDGENYVGTEYFIMDYEQGRFSYVSNLLTESDGGLNARLTLTGDISLGIEEYVEGEVVTPTSIVVDKDAYNHSSAYTQSMSAVDSMTPNWQFVVTYSDGTKKILVGTNSNLDITNLITNQVGSRTATVTYKGTDVSCSVPYTIGLKITGGSGVAMGDTVTLSASGLGEDVAVTWKSLNTSIATVNETTGVVTPVSTGTVTITATADGYDVSDSSTYYLKAEYEITVTAEKVAVESVKLNKDSLTLEVGHNGTLYATVSPSGATNSAVSWSSSKESVAVVSSTGVIKAIAEGSTVITVTTADGGKTATCTVTVVKTVPVESVTISGDTEVAIGSSNAITLTATVLPANATNNTVTWSVVNGTGSATITSSGVLTGVSAGTVTVFAKAGEKEDSYVVTVKGVRLDNTNVTLALGTNPTATLTATLYPEATASQTVTWTWTSGDEKIATVADGVITAVGKGTVTITVKAIVTEAETSVEYTATCTVTVTSQTFNVTFNANGVTTTSFPSNQKVEGGSKATEPTAPEATGYTFGGWYTDEGCQNKYDFDTTITGNITLYAKWTPKAQYTVTFDMNGHGGENVVKVGYAGDTLTAPDEPSETGYTFGGWYTAATGGTKVTEFTTFSETVTYYAHWTAKTQYTVTFDMNGHGTNTTEQVYDGDKVEKPTDPTASGYVFKGWYSDEGLETAFDFNTAIKTHTTIYAKWVQLHTVTFNVNGKGSSVIASQTVEKGGYATTPEEPTASGYTFGGWYKEAECTNEFVFASTPITGDITLYAKWTEETATDKIVILFHDTIDITGGTLVTSSITGSYKGSSFTYNGKNYTGPLKIDSGGSYTFKVASNMTAKVYLNTAGNQTLNVTVSGVTTKYTATNNVFTFDVTGGLEYKLSRADGEAQLCCIELTPTGEAPSTPTVESVTVTAANGATAVAKGGTLQLSATVNGTNSPKQTVTWSIKSGATATGASVSNDGLLTAGTVAGSVTIVATSTVDGTKSGEITITVLSVTITNTNNTVEVGKTINLIAEVLPEDAPNNTVTWAITSGGNLATIDEKTGVLTAGNTTGTVTVTATVDGVTSTGFDVIINAATPTITELTHSGTTTFKKGSSNPTSDWVFTATYSDGTTKNVTSSVSLSVTVSTDTVGNNYSVTASYTENDTTKECTVNYKVIEPKTIVYVTGTGTTSFTQNATASTAGWQFTVTYSDDNTTETVTAPDSRLSIGEISTTTVTDSGSVEVSYTECEKTVKCNVVYKVTAASATGEDKIDMTQDTNTTSHELSLKSEKNNFTISSNGKFQYATKTLNSTIYSGLFGSGKSRSLIINNISSASVTITLEIAFGDDSGYSSGFTATVSNGDTIDLSSSIVGKYNVTLVAGQSITITTTKYIALISATAVVTPATTT